MLNPERQRARMSKNLKGGIDQYGAERFDRLIFATVRKSETERVNQVTCTPFTGSWTQVLVAVNIYL